MGLPRPTPLKDNFLPLFFQFNWILTDKVVLQETDLIKRHQENNTVKRHIKCTMQKVYLKYYKRQGGCQYFILLTLKKRKSWTQGSWIFLIKKTNPGLLFLLKVRSCVFISNFHHSPPPLPSPPKGYKIVSLIIN